MKRLSIALLLAVIMVTTSIVAQDGQDLPYATTTTTKTRTHRHHYRPRYWGDDAGYGAVAATEDAAVGAVDVAEDTAEGAVDVAADTVDALLGR